MATKIGSPTLSRIPSPWGKTDSAPISKFTDVMDEEYAKQLVEIEELKPLEPVILTASENRPFTGTAQIICRFWIL